MSKQVTVRYFAAFRERAGRGEEAVQTDAATAGDLFEALPSFRVDLSSTELRADWPSTADP